MSARSTCSAPAPSSKNWTRASEDRHRSHPQSTREDKLRGGEVRAVGVRPDELARRGAPLVELEGLGACLGKLALAGMVELEAHGAALPQLPLDAVDRSLAEP